MGVNNKHLYSFPTSHMLSYDLGVPYGFIKGTDLRNIFCLWYLQPMNWKWTWTNSIWRHTNG